MLWFLYSFVAFLCFKAMNETKHLNLLDAVTLMALGSIGFLMPVPGGIGAYHAVIIISLTEIYKISEKASISFAYLAHTTQTSIIIILGIISLLLISASTKKNKENVNNKAD